MNPMGRGGGKQKGLVVKTKEGGVTGGYVLEERKKETKRVNRRTVLNEEGGEQVRRGGTKPCD